MSTAGLITALKRKFDGNGYALLTEVGNGTGSRCTRHADALVMSLFPSRGLTLSGFELKQSRTDWLKELRDASKADAIARYCHFWNLVVSDLAIVKEGELPPTWGMWTLSPAGKLVCIQQAKPNEHQAPLDWIFMAAVMRQIAYKQKSLTREERLAIEQDVANRERESARNSEQHLSLSLETLTNKVHSFERETGLSINSRFLGVEPRTVASAMRVLGGDEFEVTVRRYESLLREVKQFSPIVESAIRDIQKLRGSELVTLQKDGGP